MKARKLVTSLLALMVAAAPLTAFAENKTDNPDDIGNRRVAQRSIISWEKEIAIGKQYSEQIDRSAKILKDPVVNEYVNRVEQNIARNSDVKIPITVKIIDDPSINAMTLPGGFMYVNTGLLKVADTEDELAGVLAHETGHVAVRSWASEMTRATILQYAMIPLMFTPMSAALYYGVMEAYMNGVPMAFLKFSRTQEQKADFMGLQYMWKAGYDPNGMLEMFGKIEQLQRSEPGSVPTVFEDHPPTGDRIIRAEEEIKNLLPKKQEYLVNTSEFDAMKGRLAMVMSNRMKLAKSENGPTLEKRKATDKTQSGTAPKNSPSDNEKPPVLERRN